ncbi:MAG: UbiA family prenyltransferase [Clostridiales bacterium]
MEIKKHKYKPLTFQAWYELATPNTWGASIIPVLLGSTLAYTLNGAFNGLFFILLLICSILMHCAVNAMNHLFDYLKGTDSLENCLDPHDAPMVYHRLNPKTVFSLACFYLLTALLLGLYLISQVGFVILFIGIIGGLVVVFYAGGPFPITHTPLGEFFAGFTMGGLITFAVYYTMTQSLNWLIFFYALPLIIAIGCILLLNNTCDIEKDIEAKRHTLPIIIGRKKATLLLKGGYIFTAVLIAAITVLKFTTGSWLFFLMLIPCYKKFKAVMTMEFKAETRMAGMKAVLPLTPMLNIGYVLAIFAAGLLQ